jgi:hypothetical protein
MLLSDSRLQLSCKKDLPTLCIGNRRGLPIVSDDAPSGPPKLRNLRLAVPRRSVDWTKLARDPHGPKRSCMVLGHAGPEPVPAVPALPGVYERCLLAQVQTDAVPRHVGLILNRNRRHGQQHNLSGPREMYCAGARKLDDPLDWCAELAIPAITLWVFSTDNFPRVKGEVPSILAATETKLIELAKDPRIHRQRDRVRAVDRLDLLLESTLAARYTAEAVTTGYDGINSSQDRPSPHAAPCRARFPRPPGPPSPA